MPAKKAHGKWEATLRNLRAVNARVRTLERKYAALAKRIRGTR